MLFQILLEEFGGVAVNIQGESVVGLFAVVAVDAGSDAVRHDVLPDSLQLVVGAVF